MGNWQEATLGELEEATGGTIRTGPFGSQLHQSDYTDEGVPVVMPRDMAGSVLSLDSIARIPEAKALELEQHRLVPGDIVYARRGDIGRRVLITEQEEGWLCGTGCLRLSFGDSVVDPKFLFYYLGQTDMQAWIESQAVGATMLNLNTSILRRVPIRFPDLTEQKSRVAALDAFDRLILMSERRITVLEQMAELLYREWFVNKVNEEWSLVAVSEAVSLNPRLTAVRGIEKVYVPMSSVCKDSMIISGTEIRTSNSGSKFQNGDTLLARITPSLEHGKTAFVQILSDEEVGIGSTEFIVMRSRTLNPFYVYFLARDERLRQHAIASMTGASGRQRVQLDCFDSIYISQPPAERLERFEQAVRPMFDLIYLLARKNDVLRRTRDLLLPQLISGAIDPSILPDPS